jgi:hypothetical protein
MLNATDMFMEGLEKWLKAVRAGDFVAAKNLAQHFTMAGDMLVIHPEFEKCFKEHCEGFEPKEALHHLCQFLLCATAGRSRVLKQSVKDNMPLHL